MERPPKVIIVSTPMGKNDYWRTLYLERRKKMEKKRRVPNNVTLGGLRRLLRVLKERAGAKAAVNVVLEMWHYDNTMTEDRIQERIGVYDSRGGAGTRYCASLKEAYDYIKTLEKEETDANTSNTSNQSTSN